IDVAVEQAARIPSPHTTILFFHLAGALGELPAAHSPAGNRDAPLLLNIASAWENARDDEVNTAWTRGCFQAMRPFSTGGVYVNFLTEEEGQDRIEAAYGKATLDKLGALKKKYDPENIFRHTKTVTG